MTEPRQTVDQEDVIRLAHMIAAEEITHEEAARLVEDLSTSEETER